MSHHFDTATARQDPRLNVCDFYLFRPRAGFTTMVLTVNPNAANADGTDTFHEEGLYAFRFDLDGDAREELTFKVRFDAVTHGESGDHEHVQDFEVRRATGHAAVSGADGDLIAKGRTGQVAAGDQGVRVFAGVAPDLFAGNSAGLHVFKAALARREFDAAAFDNHQDLFVGRNVTPIVLEVPDELIGSGTVHAWASVSLHGHAPEVQVSRWGLPLMTHLFITNGDMQEQYNRATPADDVTLFGPHIGEVAATVARLAGSTADPAAYADRLVKRVCPTVLPYELGTPAAFDYVGFNGRALTDDVMDVMLTLMSNTALPDGVTPDKTLISDEFPYYGAPHPK
jgi:hypothetical protein